MRNEEITARFSSPEELSAALSELRRSGAVCHIGTLPAGELRAPTVHLTVRADDRSLARAILRRSGGEV